VFQKSIDQIDRILEKNSAVVSLRERSEILLQDVSDDPTLYLGNVAYDVTSLRVPRKLKDKITLAIVSWYLPEEISILLRLTLEENWGVERQEVGEVLLTSKSFALAWLLIQDDFNENDFFGNYLSRPRVKLLLRFLEFKKRRTNKVKRYTGYSRGHRDGTHRSPTSLPRELQPGYISEEEDQIRRLIQEQKTILLFERVREFLKSVS
jgi:hypothetical protein